MVSRICDRVPCPFLQEVIQKLRYRKSSDGRVELLVLPGDSRVYSSKVHPLILPLEYCPACGTRIDPDWLNSFLRKG